MPGRLDFELKFGREPVSRTMQRPTVCIFILGDFSGDRDAERPSGPLRFDVDTFDELFGRLRPSISFRAGSAEIRFRPGSMDDFHPDHLFRSLDAFAPIRERLTSLQGSSPSPSASSRPESPAGKAGTAEDEPEASMLSRLLGDRPGPRSRPARPSPDDALARYLEQVVADDVVKTPGTAIGAIDALHHEAAELLRGILHHETFQRLESHWRALHELVFQTEAGDGLDYFLVDGDRRSLAEAVPRPGDDIESSPLHRMIRDATRSAPSPAVRPIIVGDLYFRDSEEDIALLAALGSVAMQAGGVFLGGVHPGHFPGAVTASRERNGSSAWLALRSSGAARHIGLALPRVLGRLPYGEETESVDCFPFEEQAGPLPRVYLWTHPAFLCARVLAESHGRGDGAAGRATLGSLPFHAYRQDGEPCAQPPVEYALTERDAVALLNDGLIPLIGFHNSDQVVVPGLRSLADPPALLLLS